jgi:hypothetical protein
MRASLLTLPALGLLASIAACSQNRAENGRVADRKLLTREQFANKGYNSPYDVIAALRSNWLATRGPDSFQSPSQVIVYLDGARLGGVDALRSIDIRPVTYIQYFDGVTAAARWGLDHGAGVIFVSTHPLSNMIGASGAIYRSGGEYAYMPSIVPTNPPAT